VIDTTTVAALLAQVQALSVRVQKPFRTARWWLFFAVAVVSMVTGILGGVSALQRVDTQPIALGILLCALTVVVLRILLRRKGAAVTPLWHPHRSLALPPTASARVVATAHVPQWHIWMSRWVRYVDFLLWVLMAGVLVCAASVLCVFSLFGLWDGLQSGVDISDVVLVMGVVGPVLSVRSGVSRWQARHQGSRQRMQSCMETLRNALAALNNAFRMVRETTTTVARVGANTMASGVVAVTTTAAMTAAVAGVGYVAFDTAPRAIIATGKVVPLPMEVALLAGESGVEVGLRGTIVLSCMNDFIDADSDGADMACQQAVRQVDESCATWDGREMPPSCEQRIVQLMPEIKNMVSHESPAVGPERARPNNQPLSPLNTPNPATPVPTTMPTIGDTASPTMVATVVPSSTPLPTQTEPPQYTATVDMPAPAPLEPIRPPNMTQLPGQGGNAPETPIVRGPNNNPQGTPLDTPIAGNP
jgi:hypothetical protein